MMTLRNWIWITFIFLINGEIHFPRSDDPDECATIEENIIQLISFGAVSKARWRALESLRLHPDCQERIQKVYKEAFDQQILELGNSYLQRIAKHSTSQTRKPRARKDSDGCVFAVDDDSRVSDPTKEWDECCSVIPKKAPDVIQSHPFGLSHSSKNQNSGCVITNPCCEFYAGSPSHLRLPALYEPALRVRLSLGESKDEKVVLELEQDGYLRLFDVAGILWPSGYLLTLCISNPIACGVPEIHEAIDAQMSSSPLSAPVALELGAGVGAPSIGLALHLREYFQDYGYLVPTSPLVVSTDIKPHALALTIANARSNEASIVAMAMNHTNVTSALDARRRFFTESGRGGFSLVIGSSLQSLFSDTQNPSSPLWNVLNTLLDNQKNSKSCAVFVHTRSEPLQAPRDGSFSLVRRVSGDVFDMATRAGESSDFEVSIFRRSTQKILSRAEL